MSPERKYYRTSIDEIISNAQEIILRDGHHVSIMIVEGSRDMLVSQLRKFPDTHEARMELIRFIGLTTAMSGKFGKLRQVFMVSEGWMSIASQDKPSKRRPSEDPNKKEVLIVSGLQILEKQKFLKLFEILRDTQGKVIDLLELMPNKKKKTQSKCHY